MRYDAAPLEGITGWVYRQVHNKFFPWTDRYYAPFAAPNHTLNFKTKEKEDLLPAHNGGLMLVPQILSNRTEEFLWAAREMYAMGYGEVNLNLGCPVPMIARKGKGSGMLAFPEELDRFLEGIFDGLYREGCGDLRISVKTRLGTEDFSQAEKLMSIYRRYPLSALVIHPRTQKDLYRNPADPEMFASAFAAYMGQYPEGCDAAEVYYNGDLQCVEDCRRTAGRFPGIAGIMLGRGLLANPALIREAKGGPALTARELKSYHDAMWEAQRENLPGDAVAIGRMKELWLYMGICFSGAERPLKEIRKARDRQNYESAVRSLFTNARFTHEP